MATKKTTTKKTPAKKKPAVKATKATVKRVSKPNKKVAPKAIGLQREEEPFMTFRVNRQTVYWLVLGAVVILFTVWIMRLQMDIQSLYDEIDSSAAVDDSYVSTPTKK